MPDDAKKRAKRKKQLEGLNARVQASGLVKKPMPKRQTYFMADGQGGYKQVNATPQKKKKK